MFPLRDFMQSPIIYLHFKVTLVVSFSRFLFTVCTIGKVFVYSFLWEIWNISQYWTKTVAEYVHRVVTFVAAYMEFCLNSKWYLCLDIDFIRRTQLLVEGIFHGRKWCLSSCFSVPTMVCTFVKQDIRYLCKYCTAGKENVWRFSLE